MQEKPQVIPPRAFRSDRLVCRFRALFEAPMLLTLIDAAIVRRNKQRKRQTKNIHIGLAVRLCLSRQVSRRAHTHTHTLRTQQCEARTPRPQHVLLPSCCDPPLGIMWKSYRNPVTCANLCGLMHLDGGNITKHRRQHVHDTNTVVTSWKMQLFLRYDCFTPLAIAQEPSSTLLEVLAD